MTPDSELEESVTLSDLWHDLKFRLCFAVPMHFTSTFVEAVQSPGADFGVTVTQSWWQWRAHVFWLREVRKFSVG